MENNNSSKKVTICTLKAVQSLFEPQISQSTAFNYIHQCRDALNKQSHHILTIKEFKEYFNIENN